jgi:hypothetical protein
MFISGNLRALTNYNNALEIQQRLDIKDYECLPEGLGDFTEKRGKCSGNAIHIQALESRSVMICIIFQEM